MKNLTIKREKLQKYFEYEKNYIFGQSTLFVTFVFLAKRKYLTLLKCVPQIKIKNIYIYLFILNIYIYIHIYIYLNYIYIYYNLVIYI